MNLHHENKTFADAIQAAAQALKIDPVFIEKDYWISYILWKLSQSKNTNKVVFKGGTSLSKGHQLINRFSEDIDLAIINVPKQPDNQVKKLIRDVEKEITSEFKEIETEGVTRKFSKFRKVVFEYTTTIKGNPSNKILVETNSFANPFPYAKMSIETFVAKFFRDSGNSEIIKEYALQPFEINVMDALQTMVEKLVSLVRFSFEDDPIDGTKSKIRHFYDLYYLSQTNEGKIHLESGLLKKSFEEVLAHDRKAFDEPKDWSTKGLKDSSLINDFDSLWHKLKDQYKTELSGLAFAEIPDERDVAEAFKQIIDSIV